jgi:hypothetical protein
MPKKPPTPEAGNAPEGILEPPEPEHPLHPDHPVDAPVPVVAPEPLAPGVYSGVWPNLVLTATVDDNGVMVPVPEATATP